MNLSIAALGERNGAIAERLFGDDFDARDTSASQIGKLMDAARLAGAAQGASATAPITEEMLNEAAAIIRGFLDAPRTTYEGIEHPEELVARAEAWVQPWMTEGGQ